MSTSLLYAPLRVSRRTARSLATLAPVPVNAALRHHTPWQARSASTQPAYEGHVPLNWFEHGFLTLGSAFMALANPRRGGTSLQHVQGMVWGHNAKARQIWLLPWAT